MSCSDLVGDTRGGVPPGAVHVTPPRPGTAAHQAAWASATLGVPGPACYPPSRPLAVPAPGLKRTQILTVTSVWGELQNKISRKTFLISQHHTSGK